MKRSGGRPSIGARCPAGWPASSRMPWALAPTLATRTTGPRPPALSLPTRTPQWTPHGFAATLGGAKERRNRQGLGVLEIRPGGSPWSCAGDLAAAAGTQLTMESFESGWRCGSRNPVWSGSMLVTARPRSLLDLLAGCAARSRWRRLHDDQPRLPAGDLLLDSPVWPCVVGRFVLERRGTDVDP